MAWSAAAALLVGRVAAEAVGRSAADRRRRLPGGLAVVVDACLGPGLAVRPTIGRLAETFDALLPSRRR